MKDQQILLARAALNIEDALRALKAGDAWTALLSTGRATSCLHAFAVRLTAADPSRPNTARDNSSITTTTTEKEEAKPTSNPEDASAGA